MATATPACASLRTIAAPMPREPPVTSATRPRRVSVVIGTTNFLLANIRRLQSCRKTESRSQCATGFLLSTPGRRSAPGRRREAAGIAVHVVGLWSRSRPGRVGIAVAGLVVRRNRAVCLAMMALGCRGELHRRRDNQGRAENGEHGLAHYSSPFRAFRWRGNGASRVSAAPYLTMARADYYAAANHEAASKFLGQKLFRLNIQQRLSSVCNRLATIRFDERMRLLRVRPMKKILLLILLMASPAWAQTQLTPKAATPKGTAPVVDNCAPIGRTAKGELD